MTIQRLHALLLFAACCAPARVEPPDLLGVGVGGCVALADGVCSLGDGPVRLWTSERPDRVIVNGRLVDAPAVPAADGFLTVVTPPPGGIELWVGHARFALATRRDPVTPRVAEARAALAEGACDRIVPMSSDGPTLPSADEVGELAFLRGRCLTRAGALDAAADALAFARSAWTDAPRKQAFATLLEVEGRLRMGQIDVAATLLEQVPPSLATASDPPEHPSEAVVPPFRDLDLQRTLSLHRAKVAGRLGDTRAALAAGREALLHAQRLGDEPKAWLARLQVAIELGRTGRHDEATRLLDEASGLSRCDEVDQRITAAWERLQTHVGDPLPLLTRASELLDEAVAAGQACPLTDHRRANIQVNLALAWLDQGDATAALAALPTHPPEWESALWSDLVHLRAAVMRGDLSAAEADLRHVRERSAAAQATDVEVLAMDAWARGLSAAGRRREAIDVWYDAAELARAREATIPLDQGRADFAAIQADMTAAWVGALVADGRGSDAMAVARAHRAAALRDLALAERLNTLSGPAAEAWRSLATRYAALRREVAAMDADAWRWRADEARVVERRRAELDAEATRLLDVGLPRPSDAAPRAPAHGELLVLWTRTLPALPGSGWVVFTHDERGVRHHPMQAPSVDGDPTALADVLFGPIADELGRAAQVTLLPSGPLGGVDLHALPFGDVPLVARTRVAYGLDVPTSAATHRVGGPLVVADARLDLQQARREGEDVAARLSARLLTGDDATWASLVEALPSSNLFYYAGHARFDPSSWGSALELAGTDALNAGDVLALPGAPEVVVLSACASAQTRATTVEDIGLAQAFVLMGARAALATTRPVPDAVSRRFGAVLPDPTSDPVGAFRAAVLALREADPSSDWSTWRVLVP